jgi:hypothetical protein
MGKKYMYGYGKEQSEILLSFLFSFLFVYTVLSLIQTKNVKSSYIDQKE